MTTNIEKFISKYPNLIIHNNSIKELKLINQSNKKLINDGYLEYNFQQEKLIIPFKHSLFYFSKNPIVNDYCLAVIKDKYNIDNKKLKVGDLLWSYEDYPSFEGLKIFSFKEIGEYDNSIVAKPIFLNNKYLIEKIDNNNYTNTVIISTYFHIENKNMREYLLDVYLFCKDNDFID